MSEQMVYRIRDWRSRYEVSKDGREAKDGDDLRKNPLDFVRWQARGRDLGIGLRRLNKLAGHDAPAVFGVFAKLVEIAAQNERDKRGHILTSDGDPMSAEDISELTEWQQVIIDKALTVLCDPKIKWLECVPLANLANLAEFREPLLTELNRTELNGTELKPNRTARARNSSASDSADSASQGEPAPEPAQEPEPESAPTTSAAGNLADTLAGLTGGSPQPEAGISVNSQQPDTQTAKPIPTPQPAPSNAPGASCAVADRKQLNALWRRIRKATGDTEQWMAWWTEALPEIIKHDAVLGALLEAIGYAEDCADENRRTAKGLGPLQRPGGYIVSKTLKACNAQTPRVALPQTPQPQTPTASKEVA